MTLKSLVLSTAFLALALMPARAAIYADSATSIDTTVFGSGILTGAPDEGGEWLGSTEDFDDDLMPGSITFEFFNPIMDGVGDDLRVYDVGVHRRLETFNVEVSADGLAFVLIGEFNAFDSVIDIAGIFSDPFRFVRLTSTSSTRSADIDALEAYHLAPVPLPAALPLFAAALGGAGFVGWRRRRRDARPA